MYLAKYLGISKKRITYCGTKDKRGITTQYFCLNHKFQPESIRISDVEIVEYFSSSKMLGLGDLRGNRFRINLRIDKTDVPRIRDTYEQVLALGGFPNFFGLQRFGSIRTNTHKIGKLIIQGEYEKAAMTYLYDPEFDHEDYRVNFSRHNDPKIALKEFPERLTFERSLLGYLDQHGNLKEAFSVFPRNLSIMFVHAYQSYLFNRIVSERIESDQNIRGPQVGDTVLRVDDLFNPDKGNEIVVNRLNLQKITEMADRDLVRTSIPIIGYESELSRGVEGELELKLLEEERIMPKMFRIQGYPELSSKGEGRIISCKPKDFRVMEEGIMEFSLGRGIYATSFIRELVKEKLVTSTSHSNTDYLD